MELRHLPLAVVMATSASLHAQPTVRGNFSAEDLDRVTDLTNGVQFTTWIKTPDVLDPAVVPYLNCKLQNSGATLHDERGNESAVNPSGPDCAAERTLLFQRGQEILAAEGLKPKQLQEVVLRHIVVTIDHMIRVQAMDPYASEGDAGAPAVASDEDQDKSDPAN